MCKKKQSNFYILTNFVRVIKTENCLRKLKSFAVNGYWKSYFLRTNAEQKMKIKTYQSTSPASASALAKTPSPAPGMEDGPTSTLSRS